MAETKKQATRHPRKRGGAESDTTPRKADKGVPDDMQRRYEAGEQGAGSTTVGDEIDQAYEDGKREGSKSTPDTPTSSDATPAPAKSGSPRLTSGGHLAIGAPLAIETILISVNSFTGLNNPGAQRRPPLPSQLLVAWAFFGLLGMASGNAAGPAAALGWGVVVATFYSGSGKGGKPPAIGVLNTVGGFFGGKYAVKGSSPAAVGGSVPATQEAGTTGVGL